MRALPLLLLGACLDFSRLQFETRLPIAAEDTPPAVPAKLEPTPEPIPAPTPEPPPGPIAKIAFVASPTALSSRLESFSVTLAVTDADDRATSGEVALALVGGSNGTGELQGLAVKAAVDGAVTFDDLRVSRAALGLTMTASAGGTVLATSAPFDVPAWHDVSGPLVDDFFDVLAVSADGTRIYVGGSGAVFRSLDGGASFQRTAVTGRVCALAIASDDVLYAGTFGSGVSKSIDGGAHWTKLSLARSIACELAAPSANTVMVGVGRLAANTHGMSYSSDGGAQWQELAAPIASHTVESIALAPSTCAHAAYAATENGLYVSDDYVTWALFNPTVDLVHVVVGSACSLYMASAFTVYRNVTAGAQTAYSNGISGITRLRQEHDRVVVAGGDSIYVARAIDATLVAVASGGLGLVKDIDASHDLALTSQLQKYGATWTRVGPTVVRPFANRLHVTADELMLVGIDDVVVRAKATATWSAVQLISPSTIGQSALFLGQLWLAQSGQVYRRTGQTLALSISLATTVTALGGSATSLLAASYNHAPKEFTQGAWADYGSVPDSPSASATAITIAPNDNVALAAVPAQGIARTINGGASAWTQVSPAIAINRFVWTDTAVYASSYANGVYRSKDNGSSWEAMGLANLNCSDIAAHGDTVYAATEAGVKKSADGGETWRDASVGIASEVRAVAIDPENPDVVYAVAERYGVFVGGVFQSDTAGE